MTGPTLRLGSTGEEVRRLQESLRARGYRIQADGYYGASTYGAVLAFQQRHRIPADGATGTATWRALDQPDERSRVRPDEQVRVRPDEQSREPYPRPDERPQPYPRPGERPQQSYPRPDERPQQDERPDERSQARPWRDERSQRPSPPPGGQSPSYRRPGDQSEPYRRPEQQSRPGDRSQDGQAEWNVMVYMAGNNNLSDAAGRDLEEMRAVAAYNGVRVTAFVKRQDVRGRAERREIHAGGMPDVIEHLQPPVDSGHPQTMVDFVRWAGRHAPAKRYALVIWNHGGGWTPDDLDQLYTHIKGHRSRHDAEEKVSRAQASREAAYSELARLTEAPQVRKSIFTTSLGEIMRLPDSHQRAIASDDGTLHSLDTLELASVLRQIHTDLGKPLDLLGMDACLMSSLEVCYEIREHVGTVVGSEELEPNDGWPYAEILTALAANPRMDARELGQIIVDEYIRSYRDTGQTVTQCAVDATRIEEFMREFQTLAESLRHQVRANRSVVDSVQSVATRFHADRSLVDLRTLCLALVVDTRTDPTLQSVADKILALHSPGGFVIHEDRQGEKVAECGGLSAYFPMERTISPYYRDLQIARDTEWDAFLSEYGDARGIGGRRPRRP